eukprot:GILJ01018939.1.p2 GENE.GILJ01018939.1~~GILJ01018939.1.p2  ORF type:complete len:103 (-),score=5.12 GILJ01018939.1:102-410(-)
MRLKILKSFSFGDDSIKESYRNAKTEAYTENEHRDDHCTVTENFSVHGYVENILVSEEDVNPCLMSTTTYWIFSLLLLSWPYRVWLHLHTSEFVFHLEKKIS